MTILAELSDELLSALDRRAALTGSSRSELIRTAIEAYLAEGRSAEIDAAIVAGYERFPADAPDRWAEAATIEAIRAEPW